MNITFDELKEILYTLPIGYYANRRVEMELKSGIKTSYYNQEEDKIVISYDIIVKGLATATLENQEYKETAIRTMLYHELSHTILTPHYQEDTFEFYNLPFYIFNIFEDERIETILKDFYLDVNFKKNLLYICGGSIPQPTNVDIAFFNLVRFRSCPNDSFIQRIEEIITIYRKLNATDNEYNNFSICNYLVKIRKLYQDFKKYYDNNDLQENEEQNKQIINDINNSNQDTSSQLKSGSGQGFDKPNIFTKVINQVIDTDLTNTLDSIIANFNKKTNNGNGTINYSGMFNPRNCTRKDYRYFDRQINANGNNKYGKFHLNLFIDNSGSFNANRIVANTLIKSLLDIEKKNKNFTFEVFRCGDDIKETTKQDCFINANERTASYYEQAKYILKKYTKKDSYVYNIVMYDGLCSSRSTKNCFLPFNIKNCTIIDTGENRKYFTKFTAPTIRYVRYGQLVNELKNEVIKALQRAFR